MLALYSAWTTPPVPEKDIKKAIEVAPSNSAGYLASGASAD